MRNELFNNLPKTTVQIIDRKHLGDTMTIPTAKQSIIKCKMDENKIVEMLLKHEADIQWLKENVVTKQEMTRVYDTLDQILGFVTKHDQELMFLTRLVQDHELKLGMA